jgi:hypothetical protein
VTGFEDDRWTTSAAAFEVELAAAADIDRLPKSLSLASDSGEPDAADMPRCAELLFPRKSLCQSIGV